MKPAIIYMLEVLVCSGVLLAAYAIPVSYTHLTLPTKLEV